MLSIAMVSRAPATLMCASRPVAAVAHARYFRGVKRSDAIKLMAADHVAIEAHGRVEVGHRQPDVIDMR